MAIYLSRKKGGTVATPITPSNTSPAQMTANVAVNPTANGYAIESYSSVTPSNSSPVTLTSGDVVKLGGNGYAIESYTTKSPNNSTPVALISGEIDKINGNGYAIESYSSITPSNSSPATITSGSIYKASANGKAVSSVTNVTPSSTPTSLSYGDIIQTFGSGVIVDSITSITPSNSSPVALSADTPVNPTDSGYAIASYEEIDVPSATYRYLIRPDMPTISRVGALIGVEQMHYHSLDPSNSDPDTITDGEIYRADGSGVAVASVTGVMPSSTPTSVSMDDIVHIYGSGVIVDSIPTPTSLTPSNSSPATITSGETYTATASGKAVASVTDITPSNSSPVSLSSGSIYKPSASGYAISSYSSKTPSDSSPASVSSGAIIKASASGYLYSTQQPKVKMGSLNTTAGTEHTINCGFKPSKVFIYAYDSTNKFLSCAYDENLISEYSWEGYRTSSSSANAARYAFTSTSNGIITGITSTGFKWRGSTTFITIYYVAIG